MKYVSVGSNPTYLISEIRSKKYLIHIIMNTIRIKF